ncbi:MAG: patched family protein [Bacteroidetes bacterium]|nr:MAG: patched family protein [Bacteroidota bacterium]REK03382.1 MAG: patched family protein [Bacteroidota bacterium]REK34506.1 MAG: patched family protein [Bacteroidota bacterium]REK50376.1 MAG: patched family protein [Bacteroidota bacterium]
MLEATARIIIRYRYATLFTLLALTGMMAFFACKVQLSYEGAKILPPTDSTYSEYLKFKAKFGEDGTVMVIGFQNERIWDKAVFCDWYDLTNRIKNVEGIQEVVSIGRSFYVERNDSSHRLDFKPLISQRPSSQAEVDSIRKRFMNLPFYEGLLYNPETNSTLVAITFDQSKLNTKSRISMVREIKAYADEFAQTHKIDLHYSGLPYIRTAVTEKIVGEMKMFVVLAFIVTSLILLAFFRSFNAVLWPMIVVLFGVIWSFGTLVLFGFKITILTSLIAPLIIVIGIPNCILLLNKYQQEFAKHGNKIKALVRTIYRTGVSTFFANVTTALGFLVFAFTHSDVLIEFGLITSINVMVTFIISLIFIPIVYSFLPAPSERQVQHLERRALQYFLDKIDYLAHYKRKWIYLTVAVLVTGSLYGMTKITTVGYVVDDLPKKDIIYKDLKFFESNFKGVLPFEVAVDTKNEGGALELKTLYKINRLQKLLANYQEFSEPVSVAEGIKFSYQGLNDNNPKYYIIPNVEEMARLSSFATGAKDNQRMFKSIIDSSKQVTRVSFQVADIGSIKMKALLEELKPRIDSIFDPEEYNIKLTGNSIIFLKNNDYLLLNLKESVLLAILLIGSVMFFLFMSFRMVAIALIPSMTPLLLTAAIMGYFDIPLKPSTILIFSIAFGIASDGTMYFLTKYRQELRKYGGSISKTVSNAIQETGVSMIYSAIILFSGFFIFTASSFGGTSALGVLISVTLLIALCSNLVFLPTLLLSLEKRVITKAFLKEPLIQVFDEEEDVELENLVVKRDENKKISEETEKTH